MSENALHPSFGTEMRRLSKRSSFGVWKKSVRTECAKSENRQTLSSMTKRFECVTLVRDTVLCKEKKEIIKKGRRWVKLLSPVLRIYDKFNIVQFACMKIIGKMCHILFFYICV